MTSNLTRSESLCEGKALSLSRLPLKHRWVWPVATTTKHLKMREVKRKEGGGNAETRSNSQVVGRVMSPLGCCIMHPTEVGRRLPTFFSSSAIHMCFAFGRDEISEAGEGNFNNFCGISDAPCVTCSKSLWHRPSESNHKISFARQVTTKYRGYGMTM